MFFLAIATIALVTGIAVFAYYWVHYSRLIDQKLKEGPFAETAQLLATPEPVSVGDTLTPGEIVNALRRRGYTEARSNRMGWYHVRADGVEVFPGVDAYTTSEPGVIFLDNGIVTRIVSSRDNTERQRFFLDPGHHQPLRSQREKRRIVRFGDIPKIQVQAPFRPKNKRFFEHSGFDPIRIVRTAWVMSPRIVASALHHQHAMARMFWPPDKTWQRSATRS